MTFSIIEKIEDLFYRFFITSGEILTIFFQSIVEIRDFPHSFKRILKQMLEIGFNTLPLALMIGFFTGMIVALQTGVELKTIGLQRMVGSIVGLSLVREMGPVITAFIVSGRVGSAMAAELGTMAVSEEIDALRAIGIDPVRFIVMPRVLSSIIMLPLLTIYSIIVGAYGGALISNTYLGVDPQIYFRQMYESLVFDDISKGIGKTFIFGAIFSTVSCYMGITTVNGAEGVGKSTTRAVVISLTLILIADYFMSRFFA